MSVKRGSFAIGVFRIEYDAGQMLPHLTCPSMGRRLKLAAVIIPELRSDFLEKTF